MIVDDMILIPTCPGLYCGRTQSNDGIWGACGACPRGHRANHTSHCVPCEDDPLLYDWLYLGFMALLPLVLHWFFIDLVYKKAIFNRYLIAMHFCAFMEVTVACVITLLLSEPVGTLSFRSCRVAGLSDWYTLLHNPTPNYETTLHCTQEAVYPLYTLVLIMYALCIVLLVMFRCALFSRFLPRRLTLAVYCALYFLPALILIHAVGAGLIYYSFPYIIIILSMMSSASHLSAKLDQSAISLLVTSVTDIRNAVILIGHWMLHAYGIISITGLKDPVFHGALLALVPTPAAFYILTAQFTNPLNFYEM